MHARLDAAPFLGWGGKNEAIVLLGGNDTSVPITIKVEELTDTHHKQQEVLSPPDASPRSQLAASGRRFPQ